MNKSQDKISTDELISSCSDSNAELGEVPAKRPNISPSVEDYLKKVGQVPLLKPEQEKILFEELELQKSSLEKIISQLQNSNLLAPEHQEGLKKVFSFKRRRTKGYQVTISPETLGRLQDLIVDWKANAIRFSDKQDSHEESYEGRNRDSHSAEFEAIFTELQLVVNSIQGIQQNLVKANLLLVASIARQFAFREFPLSFLDLMQEGSIGLMTAIHKFQLEKGHRFSTYATWWISQAIRRALDEQSQLIRVPTYITEIRRRVAKASKDLATRLGREPEMSELAQEVNIKRSKLHDALRAPKDLLSLDSPVDSDSNTTIADLVNDNMTSSPEEEIFRQAQQEVIENLLSTLSTQQAHVIRLRYGLFDGKFHTLAEIGRQLEISRERARQIESEALNKLRHPTRRCYWEELLD